MSGQNNMLNHSGYYSNSLEKGFSILRGLPPPYDPLVGASPLRLLEKISYTGVKIIIREGIIGKAS